MPDAESKGRFYLPALDGIRGFAFLLVFLLHSLSSIYFWVNLSDLGPLGSGLMDFGRYGVSLFFVLSAFLVTTLLLRERERTGRVDVGAFVVRRGLRIWPLYYLLLLVYIAQGRPPFPGFPGVPYVPRGHAIFYGTFMGDFFHMIVSGGPLIHLWSIGVEEKFYLAWPWVLRKSSPKTIGRVVLGGLALQWVLNFALPPFVPNGWFFFGPLGYLDCLALGAGIALLGPSVRIPKVAPSAALGLFLVTIWLGSALGFAIDGHPREGWGAPLTQGIAALASAALIVTLKDSLSGWVAWRPLVELGKRSYGAYLFHLPLLGFAGFYSPPGVTVRGVLARLLALALTIGLSFLSHHFFERPFLKLKARFQRVPSGAVSTH